MKLKSALSVLAICAAAPVLADCGTVNMSDVGWTDITTTTSASKHVLEALGYDVDVKILSVPVTYASLSSGDLDIFLGAWIPAQSGVLDPYLADKTIDVLATNLEGTVYTLAVPTYTFEKGLQSFADINKFAESLDGKIYGIEPGNEGNTYLVSLTEKAGSGLEGMEVVESSEQGMLAQVARAYDKQEDVVFLGWAPHPMNANFELSYLPGGEEFFGGIGTVQTLARAGYAEECPNTGKLFSQISFTLDLENGIMGQILDEGADPDEATMAWLQANKDAVMAWVDGVTTADGGDAAAAVSAAFGY